AHPESRGCHSWRLPAPESHHGWQPPRWAHEVGLRGVATGGDFSPDEVTTSGNSGGRNSRETYGVGTTQAPVCRYCTFFAIDTAWSANRSWYRLARVASTVSLAAPFHVSPSTLSKTLRCSSSTRSSSLRISSARSASS